MTHPERPIPQGIVELVLNCVNDAELRSVVAGISAAERYHAYCLLQERRKKYLFNMDAVVQAVPNQLDNAIKILGTMFYDEGGVTIAEHYLNTIQTRKVQ